MSEELKKYLDRDGRLTSELRALIEGMSVSIDVSTGDHDSGNRLFGVVSEVMDDSYDKCGVTLLVYDAKPNFAPVGARELDYEEERRKFEAWADANRYDLTDAWDGWMAARRAAQSTAPVSTEQAGDAQSVRNAALEAAASLCDRFAARDMHPAECAGAIRMMKKALNEMAAPSPNNSPVGRKSD